MKVENSEMLPYYSDTIHVANPDSENCILCLWTKKERVIEKLSENNYAFIGQLYSRDYGLQILFRNLLASPRIRNLVIVGVDLNNSGDGLLKFFSKGTDETGRIIDTDIVLDEQLTWDKLALLRKRITIHDLRKIKDFSKVEKYLEKLKPKGPLGEKIIVPLPGVAPPTRFPTDFSGFKARGDDFYSAYRSLLSKISRFGIFSPEKKKLEIQNVMFFVTRFSSEDKEYLKSRKKARIKNFQEFVHDEKKVCTVMFQDLEVWDSLKDVCRALMEHENVCVMIGNAFVKEDDLEDVVELLGVTPRYKWEPDPHGNLVIRVEDGLIKVIHFSQSGRILEEFSGNNAKEIYKKIASGNKISMIYHALDIGGELKKAEMALKKGEKYVQDRE
ncbi:MAG: DUF4346 domain-containing protein [Candidatus Nanoarchaeia archaeon]